MNKVDYLIVGQGIAGSFLAFELLKRKKSFLIIDQGFSTSSSWVAAGVINPVILRRLTLSWRAPEFSAYNLSFYKELADYMGKNYFHNDCLYKLIQSEDEKKFWTHRYHKASLENWIQEEILPPEKSDALTQDFSYGLVKHSGWFDLKGFLVHFRKQLIQHNQLIEKSFNYDLIEGNHYENYAFNHLVFCEGYGAKNNPYFKHIPFGWNKGEVLTIEDKKIKESRLLKKKVFLLPLGDNQYKVGATYDRDFKNTEPSSTKKDELEDLLSGFIKSNYRVVNHEAAVRPAVRDRRPIMGKDKKSGYYIFNGLGSRGCYMAPLLSKEFIDLIELKLELNNAVRLERFSTPS